MKNKQKRPKCPICEKFLKEIINKSACDFTTKLRCSNCKKTFQKVLKIPNCKQY